MDIQKIIENIKIQLNITDNSKDLLLKLIVEDSIEFILDYTNLGLIYFNDKQSIIREISIIKYNKLGSEGLSSESYSGASQNFIDGLPKDIILKLNSVRVVKF